MAIARSGKRAIEERAGELWRVSQAVTDVEAGRFEIVGLLRMPDSAYVEGADFAMPRGMGNQLPVFFPRAQSARRELRAQGRPGGPWLVIDDPQRRLLADGLDREFTMLSWLSSF